MNKEFKINKSLLWKFMFRKALYDTFFFLIPLGILFLLFILLSDVSSGIILLTKIYKGLILLLCAIFLFGIFSYNVPTAVRFGIEKNRFTKYYADTKLNFLNKLSLRRIERKSGQKQFNTMYFDDVESIYIKRNRIILKSKNSNIFNANGKIVVPHEIENFNQFKEFVLQDPSTRNKVKNTAII